MSHRDSRFGLAQCAAAALGIAAGGVTAYLGAKQVLRRRRRFDLNGRTAIVTGGSRGLGLSIARELAGHGANVVICARDERELRAAQDELEDLGAQVLALECDVTQQDEVANVVHRARERFGSIDVLINNAGTISVGPASQMRLADYHDAMDVNFEGPLMFILEVLPEMRHRRSGRIVNIASFGGKVPAPHMAPYCASKYALVGLGETLRTELCGENVFVTTVCPGLVRTGSAAYAHFKGQHSKEKAWFEGGANAPLITTAPERLARRVVQAMIDGDAELITPWPAKLQVMLHGLSPTLGQEIGAIMNRWLPGDPGTAAARRSLTGAEVETVIDPLNAARQARNLPGE
ncbi:MAG TPA: SDR family oxidoreductase [Tepidisphaeraceae bacterium]|jgi:short-subunit dehydrogenase